MHPAVSRARTQPERYERRLVALLAVAFGLTILSFLASRIVTNLQSRAIEAKADVIGQNALVATEALVGVRTGLRRMAFLLDHLRASEPGAERHLRDELEQSRQTMMSSWARYINIPFFPGEAELVAKIEPDLARAQTASDAVLERLNEGDRAGAVRTIDALTLPAFLHADDGVINLLELNRRAAQEAASGIARIARGWGLLPDFVSASLACVASFFGVRLVRRYLEVSRERATELEQFVGRVSHDIRGPLGAVSLGLELALRTKELDAETRALLERGTRTLQRVAQLVDGLLVFATSGQIAAKAQKVSVREVLDGVVEDLQPEAAKNDISLDYERPDPRLAVACSPGVLISVVTNLVSNAIKFMPADSPVRRVSIQVREIGRTVRVDVIDTGAGLPPEFRARMFQPFMRGDSRVSGFGLGLATVRRLVEACGGEVGVVATQERGCCFWFQLPESAEGDARASASPRFHWPARSSRA